MKPSIFKNEHLAVSDPLNTLVFQGLWCMADREGRLEDRPAKIHLEINPGRAYETTETALTWLTEHHFIERYEIGGKHYIQVLNFKKHQSPHFKEGPSTIPPSGTSTGQASGQPQASPSPAALTPDSGFLTPDSLERGEGTLSRRIAECPKDMDAEAEWKAATDYYGEPPTKAEFRSWVLRGAKSGVYAKRPVPRASEEEVLAARRKMIADMNS